MHWSYQTPSSNNTREDSTHGHHQMATLKLDWLYSLQPKMEKLCTVSKNKTSSWLWLRSWTPMAKFRLKLKKVGKITGSFRYDLNQIPYDYTVEITNRFKGLDLSAWRTMDRGSWHGTEEILKHLTFGFCYSGLSTPTSLCLCKCVSCTKHFKNR